MLEILITTFNSLINNPLTYATLIIILGIIGIIFFMIYFLKSSNNPYILERFFNKNIKKIQMLEVDIIENEPIITARGIGLLGNKGLYFENKDIVVEIPDEFFTLGNDLKRIFYKNMGKITILPIKLSINPLTEEDKIKIEQLKEANKNKKKTANPYLISKYFNKDIKKVLMYETEVIGNSIMLENKGVGLLGEKGLYFNGYLYDIKKENIKKGLDTLKLFFRRIDEKTIIPINININYLKEIKQEENIIKTENIGTSNFNIVNNDKTILLTDIYISTYINKIKSIITQNQSDVENLLNRYGGMAGIIIVGFLTLLLAGFFMTSMMGKMLEVKCDTEYKIMVDKTRDNQKTITEIKKEETNPFFNIQPNG